tara:strand:+ start:664 stop:843 length:180 start_codon:yes stop_codon:yes gene_type:complete
VVVSKVTKNGFEIIAKDKTLLYWSDGFAIDNEWLYVTQNQSVAKLQVERPSYVSNSKGK